MRDMIHAKPTTHKPRGFSGYIDVFATIVADGRLALFAEDKPDLPHASKRPDNPFWFTR